MSNNVSNVTLTITDRLQWKRATGKDRGFRFIVQRAPTMRARCRKCSEYIVKGELKWGIPIRHAQGEYGWISAWQHLGCTRIALDDAVGDLIYGFESLSTEEKNEVLREVTSSLIPPHLLPLDPDDLVKRGALSEMEPSSELLRPLLRYQKEGLGWMIAQEQSDIKGGILADEMGMGKTIQMISLLLANRVVGPTIIICPVSSMLQWKAEINEHVVPGALSISVVDRAIHLKKEDMENADVVLTTYPMVEQSWRAVINKTKVHCPYCEQLFLPRQLVVHNRYFCGPKAKKTARQRKREKGHDDVHVLPNRGVQSKETIKKGLRTLRVDVDDNNDEDSFVGETEIIKERGVVGPMGMYRELMFEAGRRIRSGWEPARNMSESSDSMSSWVTSSTESEDDNEEEDTNRDEETFSAFQCPNCKFQLLRYPFCPKTGQHHFLSEQMRNIIETDNGGDDIDISASIFHSIKWTRIVLDEAHRIKGRNTSTSRATFALQGEYRWCLTGTPLQNRVGDVYSLIRFLRMTPFARYYCGTEGCSCSSFSHPFSGNNLRQCIFCGHGPVQHYAYFNRHIMNPILRYGYVGDGRQGMMKLANEVLQKCMLRRTKIERASDLHLPPLSIKIVKVKLTKEERNFYDSLYKKSTATFDTFVDKGTVLHNYAHIFQLLSRLRRSLDHPLLVVESMNVGKDVHPKGVCGICTEGGGENSIHLNPCKHIFHRICLTQFIEGSPGNEYHCPTCFVIINIDLRQLRADWDEEEPAPMMPPELDDELSEADHEENPVHDGITTKKTSSSEKAIPVTKKQKKGVLSRIDLSKPIQGSKLDAITEYIQSVPKDEKIIIFSQFGDMLELLQIWLQRASVKAVKLTGALMLSQRQAVLQAFLHDTGVRAILISLKAGGEGLNLQVANHVILVDPWWNPAVEMQAAQRAHRIGQTRPVHVIRFVVEQSVEERMMDLQDKKMLVIEGTIDGKLSSLQSLSEDDLQFLFTR
ncbi:putative DNA repair protein [Trypanosoma rangeli]|uniref:Putative DNA repair protein n=1 Tax=Trypanosoma rangeli TaxID=5698 RepID=A0A3R7MBR3_TRYRA|nr:putative DNA repair protein [Trypanosoma rangeli]RNF02954.1 putative DNA repair protein [Trypanosoma rangeli]|eukprot:RNF02954.1 putative DNA repair protein [Trypanosoma rangeli]